jgi:hypothetical protein
MPHEYSSECEQLHEMLQSLVARLEVPSVNAVGNGTVLPLPDISAQSASSPDGASLELEIESVRRALEVAGCDR